MKAAIPEIRDLKARIRSHAASRPATRARYPGALREAVVALARRRAMAGTSLRRTAHDLGLRPPTLYLWLRRKPASKFRPVAVEQLTRPEPSRQPAGTPVLVTPGGYRIEGLDAAGLAMLLRTLA